MCVYADTQIHSICHGYIIAHAYCKRPSVCSPSSPQWGVEQFDDAGDNGVFQPLCPALLKEQLVTEPAPLAADDSVQRVVGILQNTPQFVEGSLLCHCHQRVQLHADHRASLPDQLFQPGKFCLWRVPAPAHHSVRKNAGDHRLVEYPQELPADVEGW